jgi:hypothetical protein
MSGPSFENIDRWLFEYVEGNLTPEQEKQLEAFLLDHPEFDMDLDSWQMAKVEPLSYEFPNQETLYRKEKKRRRIVPYIFGIATMTTAVAYSIFLLIDSNEKENPIKAEVLAKTVKNEIKPSVEKVVNGSSQKSNVVSDTNRLNHSMSIYSQPIRTLSTIKSESNFYVDEAINSRIKSYNKSNDEIESISSAEFTEKTSLNSENGITKNISDKLVVIDTTILSVDSSIGESLAKEIADNAYSDIQSKKVEQKKGTESKITHSSFSFKKIIRNLNKLIGDEVGLKNTRDHQIHVPGISQLDANFSSAGDISSTRFRTLSRAQWLEKENQSFTNQISLDWFSKSIKSGFGLQGNYKLYGNGVIQNWNVGFIYSPKILLSKTLIIEPGIRYKMGSKILTGNLVNNINKVEIERDNTLDFYADGSIPIGTNQWFRDLGTSLLIHSKWFYIGAQVDNLLRHQDNIYSNSISNPRRTGMHYSINFGTEYVSKSGESSFSPYGFYEKFENREEAWGGFNFQYNAWSFGGALSNKSNFALSTGLRFSTFALTYQFDQTYSSLLGATASSHQLSIMFNTKVSRSSRRYIQIK